MIPMNCTECCKPLIEAGEFMVCPDGHGRLVRQPADCIDVIVPGSSVEVGPGLVGTVLAVTIGTSSQVRYQVAYWRENERQTEWVDDHEVAAPDAEPLRVGFHTPTEFKAKQK